MKARALLIFALMVSASLAAAQHMSSWSGMSKGSGMLTVNGKSMMFDNAKLKLRKDGYFTLELSGKGHYAFYDGKWYSRKWGESELYFTSGHGSKYADGMATVKTKNSKIMSLNGKGTAGRNSFKMSFAPKAAKHMHGSKAVCTMCGTADCSCGHEAHVCKKCGTADCKCGKHDKHVCKECGMKDCTCDH